MPRRPLPRELLQVRWAGLTLPGSSGAPPRDTGMTWSTVVAPGLPQIQHVSDCRSTWARSRFHGRPWWPWLRGVGISGDVRLGRGLGVRLWPAGGGCCIVL